MSNPWAYMPPRSALWLWIGGPILIAIVYFITSQLDSGKKKRLREAEIWRQSITPENSPTKRDNKKGAPYRPDPAKSEPLTKRVGPPRVASIPASLHGALSAVGGGEAIAHYELVRGLAYLSLMQASATAGSDYQAVTAKLEERGPLLSVRPLPLVDGVRVINTGVQFKKDPEFMSLFLVEGLDAKAIGRWLSPPVRRALCDLPDAWLHVEGSLMTLTLFGSLQADQLDALVECADTIFAEHGEGGASLFEGASEPVSSKKASAKSVKSVKKAGAGSYRTATLAETPNAKKKS